MYNQRPIMGRINLAFTDPQDEQPSYYPNAGHQIPMANLYGHPGTSTHPQAAQPTVVATSKSTAAPVPHYLCYSIFTMLFCCLPLGSAAIACSSSSRDASLAGHRELAKRSSRSALILNNAALSIGIVLFLIATLFTLHQKGVF